MGEEEVEYLLNKEQEKAIELELAGKTELAEMYYKDGREKQGERIIEEIFEEERKKNQQEEEKELEKTNIILERNKLEQRKHLFAGFDKFTDYLGIAKVFVKYQPIFYDKSRIWWIWNGSLGKWEIMDETDLMNAIDERTKNPTTESKVKYEILEALKRVGRKLKPKEPKKTWIQFGKDIYDIETGEHLVANSDYLITNPIPWKIGESEDTPNMDRIIKEWVVKKGIQDESYIKTIYEIMAYCLLADMPIHRIFCFIGDGLNGKGTFLRLIEKLV
jgi:phage/plasmid-associated DNA primase